MKPEAIEAVIWRTLKILRVCDRQTLLSHINLTHPCTQTRLTRYLNRLHADAKVQQTADGSWRISPTAPAAAPIYRKHRKPAP